MKDISLDELKAEVASQAGQKEKERGARVQLIVFKLGGEEYGLPIDHIKEVVLTPGIARIPQTKSYIRGVANIRGNVIAIIDLEEKFNISSDQNENGHFQYTLVIESESFKAGILVKQVPNTLNIYESDIDDSSGIMQFSALDQEAINGVVNVGNRLIILIDIFQLMKENELNTLTKL